ncbi:hypothetical protein PM10SUCC1_22430 [Propionigenium maris DSM 9537]|uniref:Uncharacterized protein n=1 Tax=Propionigenium maris DSM 9537 TaxID=1123000 RepID=A0A9W6GMV2_9FUSO|nr:hypothetical protein [Propionigenium maris]GLI56729.1 hypothetical protein PM10SUCC1_22430 [Propionigenium maris DSM 9537]
MTLIHREMQFIEYRDGEALFLNPDGEVRYFGYPCDNSCPGREEELNHLQCCQVGSKGVP